MATDQRTNQRTEAHLYRSLEKLAIKPSPPGASVMIEKFAGTRDDIPSEFLDLNHTSNVMILVSL